MGPAYCMGVWSMDSGRKSRRRDISTRGMIYDAAGKAIMACSLRNVSETGAKLQLTQDVPLPRSFLFALTPDGSVRRLCERVWQRANAAGVRFTAKAGA